MFQTNQPVPCDVALNDIRQIPAEEHATLVHLHNLNLHDEEGFDDHDNELEGLSIVVEAEVFEFDDALDAFPEFAEHAVYFD